MSDFGFDDWLDAQLRNVPLPPDLLARLEEIPAERDAVSRGRRMDAELNDVPVPLNLESRLRRIARRGRPAPIWRQVAMAASVFIALGFAAGYVAVQNGSPRRVTAVTAVAAQQAPRPEIRRPERAIARNVPAPARTLAAAPQTPTTEVLPEPSVAPPLKLPFGLEDVAAVSSTLKNAIEAKLRSQATLGAGGEFDRLPQLDAYEQPAPRGVTPPRVRGFDLLFLLRQGEHPFVSPAAHQELASVRVPLTFNTSSFDRALASLQAGHLPAPEDIRVEDFLAAQSGRLPGVPAGNLALHVAGSPAPSGPPSLHLIELAVQAGAQRPAKRNAAHLLAVVDTSSAMAAADRWETLRRALGQLAARMNPADRVTLVGFAEGPSVLGENLSADELISYLASNRLPAPAGNADLDAAIRAARDAWQAIEPHQSPRLVLITSGRDDFSSAASERARQTLEPLVQAGARWELIRLSRTEPSEPVTELISQTQGQLRSVESSASLAALLTETLTGRSPKIADAASVKITFNPKAVDSYRLVGHESASLTGPAADPFEVVINAEQAATALFELQLKSGGKPGEADQIAVAELTWQDAATGQPRRVVKPIRRAQLAGSFSQAPAWFQQGVIAAKAADVLRGSQFVSGTRPLATLMEMAGSVDQSAVPEPAFQDLLTLIKQADKLR